MIIKGDQQNDLRTYRFASGYTLQETMLLQALKTQAKYGLLMTNPRVTGYTSFAKAVIGVFKLPKNAPKTCKKLYQYLKDAGFYVCNREIPNEKGYYDRSN